MNTDIPVVWFVIIVFAMLMYIVMDGFDLSIGMLFSVVHDGEERDVMVNSVAPVQDGSETWLVLGGAELSGALLLTCAMITDTLVIPLMAMLIGLIFHGMVFEFRFKAVPSHRALWDYAFAGGSLSTTFSQGIVVGVFINGFVVADYRFVDSALDWLTPFNPFYGLGLVAAYLPLGTTWLIMESEDTLQQRMCELTRKMLLALTVVIATVSVWMPLGWRYMTEHWPTLSNFFWLLPAPILVLTLSPWIQRLSARPAGHARPFILTLDLISPGFNRLGINVWSNIISPNISLWDAAVPSSSQVSMLSEVPLITPTILMYTAQSYYVFRGKVSGNEGYH